MGLIAREIAPFFLQLVHAGIHFNAVLAWQAVATTPTSPPVSLPSTATKASPISTTVSAATPVPMARVVRVRAEIVTEGQAICLSGSPC